MTALEDQARSLFLAALEQEPGQWPTLLDRGCGDNAELRERVEQLLHAHQAMGSIRGADAPVTTFEPLTERPGTVIGPYKLLEQIGEGGFGVVFMAEQIRPVRRKVALKVLKPGMQTRLVVARFEAERQALALMDHPNIAHIFDGGETVSGRPYFVMELVRGIPVTDFCDQNHLPVRERLGLFVDVCGAVQHAHQKGIIHRDLKPTNVLITLHDGTPVVKVIDFGIAKALGQQLTEKTLFTNFAQMIGTPVYMSPEQAEMSALDMDTRSDVYSLGVLLYELLTGTTPWDKERLKTAAFDEIRRIIREEEPATPSTRIHTLGQAASVVSANRHSDPRRLSQLVRGDLDWIVMKALEKDRNRRYETASGLAADVRRYLHDEPVLARRPSAAYRLGRIVRRHRGLVLATSLVLLALVGGMIGTTLALIQATAAQADAVHEAKQKDAALGDREAALAQAQDRLFEALVSRARAERGSRRVGQRFETLRAIRQAAQIRVTPELRTEATAALVLPDVEIAHEWPGWVEGTIGVSFDAAFQRYARLDRQGGITVCRLSAGREEVITRLPVHGKPPFGGVRMSPDGRFVAHLHSCVREGLAGGARVTSLDGPEPAVLLDEPAGMYQDALTFHRDGRQLAIGHADHTVSVYDLATGQRRRRLALGGLPVCLDFHPRDSRLAVACGNAVRLFDTDTGRELPPLRHAAPVTGIYRVAWHPDGRRLAAGCNDRRIHLWDAQAAAEVMPPWTGHTADGMSVAFDHAGDRLVSHDWDDQTRLWDAANGRMLLTMPASFVAQFSPDDRLIGPVTGGGNKIKLWGLATGRELRVLRPRGADSLENIHTPVARADGRTLAAGTRQRLCFFDLASGEELASVGLPQAEAARPVFFDTPSPSQRDRGQAEESGGWVTAGNSGLLLWPIRPVPARPGVLVVGPPRRLAPGLESGLSAGTSASADGRVVAVPQGNSTFVLHRGRPDRSVLLGPQYDVRFTAVSPDGRWVVTCSHTWDGSSRSVRIWNAATGQQVHELPLEGSTCAKFSPDGHWLMTTAWGGLDTRLWETGTWREARRFERGRIAFSPDSRLLAIGDTFSVIRLVETATGREVARLTGPEPLWYHPACFTPDGTRLITGCSGETALYVWDLRLIRQQLKELGLDWDWPEFSLAAPASHADALPKVEVVPGDLATSARTREEKARQACEQCRRAVEANPDDADACNQLAWICVTGPTALRDIKAAVPLAEKAVRLAPGNAEHRNTLGVAYFRAGRYRDCVDTLRPNLVRQDDKGLAFDLYFLAMSYHRLGATARARDYYNWAARWTLAQRALAPGHLEELTAFQAEAEELLRIDPKKD